MINIPGAPVIGGDSNPGIWTPDSVLIGSQQSKPFYSIDMTADTLDARITYTGPEYIIFGSSAAFEFAREDEWTVEYRNGDPAGRIELMPTVTNLASARGISSMTDTQKSNGWNQYRENATNSQHSMTISFDDLQLVTAQFVFQHAGRENLALRASIRGADIYSQIAINSGVIGYQSSDFISAEIVSVTDEIKIITATFIAATGDVLFCASDTEVTNDELPVYPGDTTLGFDLFSAQIETGSLSTSPLDIDQPTGGTRTAQSAVIDTSDAKSITLVYTSGSKTYKTPDDTFTLPTAGKNWQRRLIKRIDFR